MIFHSFADHIGIQDFAAGAMENWGLITYMEMALIYDKESFASKASISFIITHELTHQVNDIALQQAGLENNG